MAAGDTLPWLLPPPDDFRRRLKAAAGTGDVAAILGLAGTALELDQLDRLSRVVADRADQLAEAGLRRVRLGLIASFTTDYITQALPATGLRHGVLIDLVKADYGQLAQTALDPGSAFAAARPEVVLLLLDPRALGLGALRADPEEARSAVDDAIAQMRMLSDGVRSVHGAVCAMHTLPPFADSLFGSYDRRVAGTPNAMIEAFNRRLVDEVLQGADLLIDLAFAASGFGLARWHDARSWHSAKLPFSIDAAPLCAEYVCRALGALKGTARKCLVLDLDNTLWGGVIGDDGLEGIRLGQGDAAGEAHVAIQALAADLRKRGVILAVCSKNEDANARQPFREHAEMVLREGDIAAFVANWNDKAGNLRDIAATLNIGTDSLVFLDDNPAERAIVRQELPEVAVPECGNDPSLYPAMIAQAGYFEGISFSDEDRARAAYYAANSARRSAQGDITNIGDYLRSLDMRMSAKPFDAVNRARIAQLTNKSNQFNLTTRRYTEANIAAFESDPAKFTLQVNLADKFGDNGMISVIIFDKAAAMWSCDTWLMSCRVLGRNVEQAALAIVARAALQDGASKLRGSYLPTKKNGLVRNHFATLGFALAGERGDGATEWELDLAGYSPPDLPMVVN